MADERKRRKALAAITARNADPEPDPLAEGAELFALAQAGGDRNLIEARDRIHAMTPEGHRRLRLALERLDDLLDAVVIERRMARLRHTDCQ